MNIVTNYVHHFPQRFETFGFVLANGKWTRTKETRSQLKTAMALDFVMRNVFHQEHVFAVRLGRGVPRYPPHDVATHSTLIVWNKDLSQPTIHEYDRAPATVGFHNFNLRIQLESFKSEQLNCGCFFDTMSDFNVPGFRPKKHYDISEIDRITLSELHGPSWETLYGIQVLSLSSGEINFTDATNALRAGQGENDDAFPNNSANDGSGRVELSEQDRLPVIQEESVTDDDFPTPD